LWAVGHGFTPAGPLDMFLPLVKLDYLL